MDLIIARAEEIIAAQMMLVDFENEVVAYVNADTDFKIIPHCYKGKFYGFNLYYRNGQDLELLETYNSHRTAKNVLQSIKRGLQAGANYYRLPAN